MKLQPCPICGGKAGFSSETLNDRWIYAVTCMEDLCDLGLHATTQEQAERRWNGLRSLEKAILRGKK